MSNSTNLMLTAKGRLVATPRLRILAHQVRGGTLQCPPLADLSGCYLLVPLSDYLVVGVVDEGRSGAKARRMSNGIG